MNPTPIPTKIGNKEISVYELETLNTKKSIFAKKPIKYSTIIVPNAAINGIQKGLRIFSPPLNQYFPQSILNKQYNTAPRAIYSYPYI